MKKLPVRFRNQVMRNDVMETLRELPSSCVNMIFGDPDYGVGINYNGKRYISKWNDYMEWYIGLTKECLRVLREDGNLFLVNYPRQNAHLWVNYLENVAHQVFEYVWVYPTNVGHSPRRFTTAHRSILHVTKSADNCFYKEQVAMPYKNPNDRRIRQNLINGKKGRMPYSWFEYNLVKNVSREKTLHACQLPTAMTDMFIQAATKPGDSVFVLFGGSGSEVMRVKALKRIFLSCEIHPLYHKMILSRLANNGIIDEKYRLPRAKTVNKKSDVPDYTQIKFPGIKQKQKNYSRRKAR